MDTRSTQALLEDLDRALSGGLDALKAYHAAPIPAPKDSQILAALAVLGRLDEAGRRALFERVADDWAGGVLSSFVTRAAIIAARQRDPAWLRGALAALPYTADPRDPERKRALFANLAIARRCATLLGIDDRLFREDLGPAPIPETATVIAAFAAMRPSDQAPEAHDMRELRTKRGIVWLAGKYPPPENW